MAAAASSSSPERVRGVTRGIALSAAAAAMIVIGACSHYGRGRRGKNGGRAERANAAHEIKGVGKLWISPIPLHPMDGRTLPYFRRTIEG